MTTVRKLLLLVCSVLLLTLIVACGSAAEQPAAKAPAAPAAKAAVPTAVPAAAEPEVVTASDSAPEFDSYWNPPTDYYGEPVYGGHIRINYEDPLEHANSWGASTGAATRLRSATMNHIVNTSPYDNTAIIPDLAKSWTQAEDGTSITFNFHEGVKWHNGEDFTCEDARFTLETWITGNGITASSQKANFSFIDLDATECVDDLTLKASFKSPTAPGLLAFTASTAFIFNKAWFEAGGEDAMFQDVSVGTGPFTWDEGQKVGIDEQRFSKNSNYFKGGGALPYIDNLTIYGILDESTQQAQMLAHQTDLHWVRNFGQYAAYVEHDQIATVIRATRGHHQLWINAGKPPFDNVKVRQAVIMGIDRSVAIKVLQEGFGSQGFIMVPGGAWNITQEEGCAVPGWCQSDDMEATRAEAKAILEGEGFDFNKTYTFTVEGDAQVSSRATLVQEQLRLLGIKVDFDLVETVAYRQANNEGRWGELQSGNATMPTDDVSLGMGYYHRCSSDRNYITPQTECDEVLEDLLDQSLAIIDPVKRKELSDKIQLYIMNKYVIFPIYWEQEAVAFWPEVRGYFHYPGPSGPHVTWEQLWYDPAHKGDTGFSGQTSGAPGGI